MDEFETLLAGGRTAVERWVKSHISQPADAEDVLQDTWLAAYQGFPALRDKSAFLPWLLGIARRKCADWYRRRARRRETLVDTMPEQASEESDTAAVDEALDLLPERDRLMLRLFYQEMLSQKQISAILHIPEGTVKSRMSTARARFRAVYPCSPAAKRGETQMQNREKHPGTLPETLPPYSIVWLDEPAFPVDCRELTGWFIVPEAGEKLVWGMYDLPARRLDVAYEMAVTGAASVHGLAGVSISARVIPPERSPAPDDPVRDAVDASTGGQEAWTFIAQEQDGCTRFLSAEHLEDGVRTLTTFLDGEAFMDNWGFGEDNRGTPVHREPLGVIRRTGQTVETPEAGCVMDLVGRCALTLDSISYDTVCLMDLGMYAQGIVTEQYLNQQGHTVLWRRFNRDDWALERYGKRWSELLPENERLTVNGQTYVHWYDCLCIR